MRKHTVYCPECATKIYNYDGISTSKVVVKCSFCGRYFRYYPQSDQAVEIERPKVETSSGARFW